MWRKNKRLASAMAAAGLFVEAGCGGGDQATSAGAAPTTASTARATATSTTLGSTTTTAPPCAKVSFSSNPDDVASDIKATGLGCADAEALVRKVGPQVSGVDGPSRVEADGFVCVRTSARSGDHGPGSSVFACTSGATKVTFVRT
jgi:hypothetical protein